MLTTGGFLKWNLTKEDEGAYQCSSVFGEHGAVYNLLLTENGTNDDSKLCLMAPTIMPEDISYFKYACVSFH